MTGVSSFCRFFSFTENGYNYILHFFRSTGWSLTVLFVYWETFVFSQNMTIKVNGRAVMIGDHTYVPKDERRMPGVVTLRQNSETQNKPSYFRGHCWGAVGVLIGTVATPFCLPLNLSLHQGRVHIGENFAAYFPAKKIDDPVSGRPPVYGEKVWLMEMFDQLHLFSTVSCIIYGRTEKVLIMTTDLLWKPAGSLIRFVKEDSVFIQQAEKKQEIKFSGDRKPSHSEPLLESI